MLDPAIVTLDYAPIHRPIGPFVPLAGGLSGARIWRYATGRGSLVIRAWPPGYPVSRLEVVHGWLARASLCGFVPAPLAGLDGRTWRRHAGRSWEVTPFQPGLPDRTGPPKPIHVRAGFRGLAAFHRRMEIQVVRGVSPTLAARIEEVHSGLPLELARIERAASVGDGPPNLAARAWLVQARTCLRPVLDSVRRVQATIVRLSPCLRDIHPDHLLFEGGRLSGLIDFGAMAEDTVAVDLARLLGEWLGDDRDLRAEALAAYESVRSLEPAEYTLIEPLERLAALLGGARWLRWHYLEGRCFDPPEAVAEGIRRSLAKLERLRLELGA